MNNKFVFAKDVNAEKETVQPITKWYKILFQNKLVLPALIILVIFIVLSLIGPFFGAYGDNPNETRLDFTNRPPLTRDSKGNLFIFGTDSLGRDFWVRVWSGARLSLTIALSAVVIEALVGITLGLFGGYYKGGIDAAVQFIALVLINIPTLIILVVFGAIFGKNELLIIITIAITGWVGMSRLVRANTMKISQLEFVQASRTFGASDLYIIKKHILPNILGLIFMVAATSVPAVIFAESILSFIGYGVQPPNSSLGSIISQGREYLGSPTLSYLFTLPSVVLGGIVMCFTVIANAMRDVFDPNQRRK